MGKTRVNWNEATARLVLEDLESTGLTLAEFARRRGLHHARIERWRKRLNPPTTSTSNASRFIELVATQTSAVVAPPPTTAPLASLTWPSGARVEVPISHLHELLASLSRVCPC